MYFLVAYNKIYQKWVFDPKIVDKYIYYFGKIKG